MCVVRGVVQLADRNVAGCSAEEVTIEFGPSLDEIL
jgi:hypothetical protein